MNDERKDRPGALYIWIVKHIFASISRVHQEKSVITFEQRKEEFFTPNIPLGAKVWDAEVDTYSVNWRAAKLSASCWPSLLYVRAKRRLTHGSFIPGTMSESLCLFVVEI